jgi:hypothetical protein
VEPGHGRDESIITLQRRQGDRLHLGRNTLIGIASFMLLIISG